MATWDNRSERKRINTGRKVGLASAAIGAGIGAAQGFALGGPALAAAAAGVGAAQYGIAGRAAFGIGSRIARNAGLAYQSSPRNRGRSYGRGASNAAQV